MSSAVHYFTEEEAWEKVGKNVQSPYTTSRHGRGALGVVTGVCKASEGCCCWKVIVKWYAGSPLAYGEEFNKNGYGLLNELLS